MRNRPHLIRRLALSVVLGAISLAAFGIAPGVTHAVAFVNAAVSRLAEDVPGTPPTDGATHSAIVAHARLTDHITAKHGDWTPIGLTGGKWVQKADELNLVAGTMEIQIPAACTGSFGNALTLSVDGDPLTFASAPNEPKGKTVRLPFLIGTLSEPGKDAEHTLTAKFGSSCSQDKEDFVVTGVSVDVLTFK